MVTKAGSVTLFAREKSRERNGETVSRLEGYGTTEELLAIVQSASKAGQNMVQVLPRPYTKDDEDRLAIEIRFFKGKQSQ